MGNTIRVRDWLSSDMLYRSATQIPASTNCTVLNVRSNNANQRPSVEVGRCHHRASADNLDQGLMPEMGGWESDNRPPHPKGNKIHDNNHSSGHEST